MEIEQFIDLVKRMREMQKLYFQSRSLESLQLSKSLEKQVDDEIKLVTDPPNQTRLF